MKNDIDDLLNRAFSRRGLYTGAKPSQAPSIKSKPARSTEKGVPAAAARPKASPEAPSSCAAAPGLSGLEGAQDAREGVLEMQQALDARIRAQRAEIEQLNQNALEDIRRIGEELRTPEVRALSQPQAAQEPKGVSPVLDPSRFDGLAQALAGEVFGQDAYLKQLEVALKRPCVMGARPDGLLGAFAVCGPADTGKALSLTCAARELARRGVASSSETAQIDLALYPTAAEEKLFLQDVYGALKKPGVLVIFTHAGQCHPGLLTAVADLFSTGSHALPGRYLEQNGRLVDAGGSLAPDAVGALTVRGKYLVLLSEQDPSALVGRFGAPFLSSLSDVCTTVPLNGQAKRQVALHGLETLRARAAQALRLNFTWSEDGLALTAAAGGAGEPGASGVLDALDQIYRALAQYCLTHPLPEKACAGLCVQDGAPAVSFDRGEALSVAQLLPASFTADSAEAVKDELMALTGLSSVKDYVLSLEENLLAQKRRRAAGLKASGVTMHMIFTGNPGTGKTTVARLVSRYLKAAGILSGGQLVEVTRADLVGRYVGHTAPMTTQVIRSALGGVLFIDEAYSLYRGREDSFGLEAIDTLVKGMEDHRDDLVVVLAGYTREMEEFLTSNSGLKSRFPNIIEFPDYTGDELFSIASRQAEGKGYHLDAACREPLCAWFAQVQSRRARDAGNGRLARNKVEEAILAQSRRTARDPQADLSLLLPEDFSLETSD